MRRMRKQNLFIDRRRGENVYAKITILGARIVVSVFVAFSVVISAIKSMSLYTHTHSQSSIYNSKLNFYMQDKNQAQKRPIQNQFRDAYRGSIVQRQ